MTVAPPPSATPTASHPLPAVRLSQVTANPGETVAIQAILATAGADIAGVQGDIGFTPGVRILQRADGRPDCTVNPSINKEVTAFAFLPPACVDLECTGVRAIVLSLENVDPIADGAVLFRCTAQAAFDAAGTLPLPLSNVLASDPAGSPLGTAAVNGSVFVVGSALPTPTPTPAGAGPGVVIAEVESLPGTTVQLPVALHTTGLAISSAEIEIGVPPGTRVGAFSNGWPRCAVNPLINKSSTAFALTPSGCSGDTCTGLAVAVRALDNSDPIADGVVLFTCPLEIDRDAAGRYPLTVVRVVFTLGVSGRIAGGGIDAAVIVSGPPATATPAPSASGPAVVVGRASARPGTVTEIQAHVIAGDQPIYGVQVDIAFAAAARVQANANGRPYCRVDPETHKGAAAFVFQPQGCMGNDCTAVRAIVLSLATRDPVADGSLLFTCQAEVADDAAGIYPLVVSDVAFSDQSGSIIDGSGIDGAIEVSGTSG